MLGLDINSKYQNPADLAHIITQPFLLHCSEAGGGVTKTPKNRLSKNPYFLVHDDQSMCEAGFVLLMQEGYGSKKGPKGSYTKQGRRQDNFT